MSFDSEVPNPSPPKQKKENKKIGENNFFLKGEIKGCADFTMI